ncbi:MAG: LCP family protein [Caldilineaceae bacterium]
MRLFRWQMIGVLLLASIVIAGCGASPTSPTTASPSEPVVDPVTVTAEPLTQILTPPTQIVSSPAPQRVLAAPKEAPASEDADSPASIDVEAPSQSVLSQAAEDLLPLDRTTNVLVLGSDRRPSMPNWRTDVIMIVAMDLKNGEAGVISIPRDVYIDVIPNHQPNRVNVIDYLGEQDEPDGGGPALLGSIIEEKMGIRIDHYLRFDFEGFKDVIDALGGVEVTVDCPVRDYLPEEDIALRLQPGTHTLTGRQALAYVRSRAQGGDLDRARRQQRMIWAVRDQIRKQNLISRVPALYAALSDSVQTDVGLVSAIRYVRFALALDEEDVHGFVLAPPDVMREGWRGGMFVFVADWELIRTQVQTLFDRPPFAESNTKEVGSQTNRCP